jgi:hypothetical protein
MLVDPMPAVRINILRFPQILPLAITGSLSAAKIAPACSKSIFSNAVRNIVKMSQFINQDLPR